MSTKIMQSRKEIVLSIADKSGAWVTYGQNLEKHDLTELQYKKLFEHSLEMLKLLKKSLTFVEVMRDGNQADFFSCEHLVKDIKILLARIQGNE